MKKKIYMKIERRWKNKRQKRLRSCFWGGKDCSIEIGRQG